MTKHRLAAGRRLAALAIMLLAAGSAHADSVTYVYDAHGQVTQVTYADRTIANYAYDAVGNRTTRAEAKEASAAQLQAAMLIPAAIAAARGR